MNEKQTLDGFKKRGDKGSRFETFADIIFGFSITLLVISSEVPKNYIALQASMYSFIGFIFCALLFFSFWNEHKTFFSRYGIEDKKTNALNFILLFVLLFYIYPMKYLFSYVGTVIYVKIKLLFGDNSQGILLAIDTLKKTNLNEQQWSHIMLHFGLGLLAIYLIFLLLFRHALSKRRELNLNNIEIFNTRTSIQEYIILSSITILSILTVIIFSNKSFIAASAVYLLIPIALIIHGKYRKRVLDKH